MDSFSSRSFAAVEAVIYIALHSGAEPVRSRDICEYQGVAVRYLEPLLQKLVRAGILRGVRGPKGGYFLARERRRISLRDILDCVASKADHETRKENPLRQYITSPLWADSKEQILTRYQEVTIAELCQQALDSGIPLSSAKRSDFTI